MPGTASTPFCTAVFEMSEDESPGVPSLVGCRFKNNCKIVDVSARLFLGGLLPSSAARLGELNAGGLTKPTHEHARLGRHPRRESIEVLVRDLLEHVALVLVVGGDAARVREEAVEAPLVQQDRHHRLRGGAAKMRASVEDTYRVSAETYEGWRFVLAVWRSIISISSFGPVTKPRRMPIPFYRQLGSSSLCRYPRTGTEDLGERVEADDPAHLAALARLELPVARHEVFRVKGEVVVCVVFEDEEVVLAREGEDGLPPCFGSGCAGRVRAGGAGGTARSVSARIQDEQARSGHGVEKLGEALARVELGEVGKDVLQLGRVEALGVDGDV